MVCLWFLTLRHQPLLAISFGSRAKKIVLLPGKTWFINFMYLTSSDFFEVYLCVYKDSFLSLLKMWKSRISLNPNVFTAEGSLLPMRNWMPISRMCCLYVLALKCLNPNQGAAGLSPPRSNSINDSLALKAWKKKLLFSPLIKILGSELSIFCSVVLPLRPAQIIKM